MNQSDIDFLEKREQAKLMAKARAKKFYDLNKERVLLEKKARRSIIKAKTENIKKQIKANEINVEYPILKPIMNVKQNVKIIETIEPSQKAKKQKKNINLKIIDAPAIIKITSNKFNLDEILKVIENLEMKPSTKTTYKGHIKRFFKVSGETYFDEFLKNPKINSEKLLKSKYAISTITSTFKIILILIDKTNEFNLMNKMNLTETQKKDATYQIDFYHQKTNDMSQTQVAKKQEDEYPTFQEYLNKIITKYGEMSKEYVISLLYYHLTVRDNFKNMFVITNRQDINPNHNYLLIEDEKIIFILNDYKTSDTYGSFEYEVEDEELHNILWWWINNKQKGNTLFGKQKISPFLIKMVSSVGYEDMDGVNFMRHVSISDLYTNPNLTFEERFKKSKIMGHSLDTQKIYRKNLK